MKGVNPAGSNADYHYANEADFFRMIERFRDYARNDVIVRQGIRRVVDSVLKGDGIKPDPDTGDKDLDKRIGEAWHTWCNTPRLCDAAEEWTFKRIARFALKQTMIEGDYFGLGLKSGQLQSVEAHRVRTPNRRLAKGQADNIIHGVQLSEVRKRVTYWVLRDEIDPTRQHYSPDMFSQIPVRDEDGGRVAFQVYDPDRYSQTRGVSVMAPICDMIGMHNDLQFAKLVQANIVSAFAIFRQYEGTFSGQQSDMRTGERETESMTSGGTKTIEGLGPGMIIKGDPGEKLMGFSPNVPNAEFFPHAMIILTIIAINIGMPVAVLLLDPTKTNFSGWRGAINEARSGYRSIQEWMIERLFQPVYEWKLRQWQAASEDEALVRLLKAAGPKAFYTKWNCPVWEYIQPEVEAEADAVRLDNMLISPRRLHAERGREWGEVADEIVEDRERIITKAIEAAARLKVKDEDVSWRDLAPVEAKGQTQPEPEPAETDNAS